MRAMLEEIKDASWAAGVPVVCDRAMGHTAIINEALGADIHLVTPLCRNEFDAYTDKVPHQTFADFELRGEEHKDADARTAGQLALKSGMTRADDTLYILDLGTVRRGLGQHTEDALLVDGLSPELGGRPEEDPAASVLLLAERLKAQLDSDQAGSRQALARQYGQSMGWLKTRLQLLKLLPEIKEAIRRGEAQGLGPGSLFQIAVHKKPTMQRLAFERSCARATDKLAKGQQRKPSTRQVMFSWCVPWPTSTQCSSSTSAPPQRDNWPSCTTWSKKSTSACQPDDRGPTVQSLQSSAGSESFDGCRPSKSRSRVRRSRYASSSFATSKTGNDDGATMASCYSSPTPNCRTPLSNSAASTAPEI